METFPKQPCVETLAYNVSLTVLEAVQRELGESRGWRICGPYSVALAHTLSMFTGIPIQRGGDGGHFQLHIGVYARANVTSEHTHLRYYDHSGEFITYIDGISELLWQNPSLTLSDPLARGEPDPIFALIKRRYRAKEFDGKLWVHHGLQPFDPAWELDVWGHTGRPSTYDDWNDMEIAMNDGSYLRSGPLTCASGTVRELGDWADGTRRAIESIAAYYGLPSSQR